MYHEIKKAGQRDLTYVLAKRQSNGEKVEKEK